MEVLLLITLVTERSLVRFLERILQFFPRKRKENQLLLVDTEHAELGVKVMAEQVRVEVLEERLANFETLVSRLDSAIEKIAEVNNNVSRMLAVHEERITKQEEIDAVLFDKIDKLRDKMDSDHDIVTQRLSLLERKLWIGIGILGAIVAFTNPQAIRTLKPLLSSAESAIVTPAVAFVNESR